MPETHDRELKSRNSLLRFLEILFLATTLFATFGSLYLSMGLGLKACPLCFYQRTFVMAAAAVCAAHLWLYRGRESTACLVTLPLIWGGFGVAAFHKYLVWSGKLECPLGLFGWSDAPGQSLAVFAVLILLGTCGSWPKRDVLRRSQGLQLIVFSLIGIAMAWACIASAPPIAARPTKPYDSVTQPLDTCRPPFVG
jgi:disulfide bond formation protein DsbB